MNKLRLRRKFTETDLAAALDQAVQAAIELGISETDLVALLLMRVHLIVQSKDEPLEPPVKTIYHPGAGP